MEVRGWPNPINQRRLSGVVSAVDLHALGFFVRLVLATELRNEWVNEMDIT
jgi:hypothetical protein